MTSVKPPAAANEEFWREFLTRGDFIRSVAVPVTNWLIDAVAVQPGETILEVAAGGIAPFPAATSLARPPTHDLIVGQPGGSGLTSFLTSVFAAPVSAGAPTRRSERG